MKILIAEDNLPMRSVIRRLIVDLADEIIECSDGQAAIAHYHEQHPDWVLMDLEMPIVNGLTATRELIAACPDARILMVTNYDDEAFRQAAAKAGVRGYVLKENLYELRQLLQELKPVES